jgi:hypothetical protein
MSKQLIKSFNEACKVLSISDSLPDVSLLPEKHQKALISHYQLIIITQALNFQDAGKEWEPNWNNWNQLKYYAWFEVKASEEKPSGFGFSGSYCTRTSTYAGVGSRLCFKTRELAQYAAKTFIQLYQDYFLID